MAVSTSTPPAPTESTHGRPSLGQRIRAWLATPEAWGVACGIVAALPAFAILVGLAQLHWAPTADDGTIVWRSWLVFSHHPPTVGQLNLATRGGTPIYDPGPMEYWAIAPFVRVWPDFGAVVAVTMAGAASIILGFVAMTQVAGRWIAAAVAAAALIGTWAAATVVGDPVWNAFAPFIPFIGLLLVSWAVATGRLGWWPVAIVLASFCLQTHLTFGAASVLLVIAAPVCGAIARRRSDPPQPLGSRWAVVGVAVGVLAWLPPLYQQLADANGNLTGLWSSTFGSSVQHLGIRPALRLYGWAVGIRPLWSEGPQHGGLPFVDHATNGRATVIWAIVMLILLAVAGVVSFRRRIHDVTGLTLVALITSIGAMVSIHGVPTDRGVVTIGYVSAILYPVGFVVWLALGWAGVRLIAQPAWTRWHGSERGTSRGVVGSPRTNWIAPVATLAVLAIAAVGVSGWVSHYEPHADDHNASSWRPRLSIVKQTLALAEKGDVPKGRIRLQLGGLGVAAFDISGIGYQLLTHGWTPTLNSHDIKMIDDQRFLASPSDPVLAFISPGGRAPTGARLLGSVFVPASGKHVRVYYRPAAD